MIKTTVVESKQRMIYCWKEIPHEEINKAIDPSRGRLPKVVEMNGEHTEPFKF